MGSHEHFFVVVVAGVFSWESTNLVGNHENVFFIVFAVLLAPSVFTSNKAGELQPPLTNWRGNFLL